MTLRSHDRMEELRNRIKDPLDHSNYLKKIFDVLTEISETLKIIAESKPVVLRNIIEEGTQEVDKKTKTLYQDESQNFIPTIDVEGYTTRVELKGTRVINDEIGDAISVLDNVTKRKFGRNE
jgi:hypothetical protein